MSSPNVQIQNLMRRYVRERDGVVSFDEMIQSLISPSEKIEFDPNIQNSLILPATLQTSFLYNFKSTFEYTLAILGLASKDENNSDILTADADVDDNIFEMDFNDAQLRPTTCDKLSNHNIHDLPYETESFDIVPNLSRKKNAIPINSEKSCASGDSDCYQYLEKNGIINNVFGGELVDVKWILYNFIVSKICKSFKTNMLDNNIRINSLHLGADSGSVQASLNHLFNASTQFADNVVQWKWASMSRSNELYDAYKANFVPLLAVRSYWKQATFILNKTSEIADRFNLIIYQAHQSADIRSEYLFAIIMALRFSDSQSVLLIELPIESKWGLLEINVLALCGSIYDAVYLTKYEIGQHYCVIICRDKKKNLNTNSLTKKLLKILLESDTLCIVDKQIMTPVWLARINRFIKLPLSPIGFAQIIENMKNSLFYNEQPLM